MGMEGRNRRPWHRDGAEQGWEWGCTEGRLWGGGHCPSGAGTWQEHGASEGLGGKWWRQ